MTFVELGLYKRFELRDFVDNILDGTKQINYYMMPVMLPLLQSAKQSDSASYVNMLILIPTTWNTTISFVVFQVAAMLPAHKAKSLV